MELLLLLPFKSIPSSFNNLHSNMELLLLSFHFNKAYDNYKFTFQYGATSTLMFLYIFSQLSIFTFQYGATSTYL